MRIRWWMLVAGVLAVAVAVALLWSAARPTPADGPVPQAAPAPTVPPWAPGLPGVIDRAWADEVAAATGIPPLAVLAYAGAARDASVNRPDCGIGWNTVAAVGLIESDHGRYGGSSIGPDGTVSPPILGPQLTGDGFAEITDTDGGALDGDTRYDRAVGPMQLLPESWGNWGYDGNADGAVDPQNIFDAAMAATNYLCRASNEDMVSVDGWRTGIAGYNIGRQYLDDVEAAARRYAAAAP